MKPTLCVYFTDTIAEKVAHLLHAPNVGKGLASTQEAIEDFVMNVEPTLYSAVIALGDYSGRDQDKLRLETTVNPAWRNTMLINYTKTTLTPLFSPLVLFKHGIGHDNSYCNYLSLLMANHRCNLATTGGCL